jgi:putative cell wall-binding protein
MKAMVAVIVSLFVLIGLVGAAAAGGGSPAEGKAESGQGGVRAVAHRLAVLQGDAPGTAALQPTMRLAGANRYETAVRISRAAWDPEDTVAVFLATGSNFPDALAMGPSTFDEGPLLLVERDRLPQIVIDELRRLRPCFVVAVGGTGVISNQVLSQAGQHANPNACT